MAMTKEGMLAGETNENEMVTEVTDEHAMNGALVIIEITADGPLHALRPPLIFLIQLHLEHSNGR